MVLGGQPSDRTDRVTAERSYATVGFLWNDRVHVFDGQDANFTACKWRVEHHPAKIKLAHCLTRTPVEELFATPVVGATQEEEAACQEKYNKRVEDDMDAIDEIVLAANNEVLNKLVRVTYAKEAMDILVCLYQKSGTGALMSMRKRLALLQVKKFDNLHKLFEEYDLIIRELDRMNANLNSGEKVHALLFALPDRYSNVRAALTVLSNEEVCRKPTATGKIKLKSVIGLNKMNPIILYNVLFTPGLQSNLLSVRKANEI